MTIHFPKITALYTSIFVLSLPLFCQVAPANWTGQVQCQLNVQSQSFVHQEIQTWTITGAEPTQQGAMQVYPATWSVTGQGGAQRPMGAQVMAAQWNNNVPGVNAPIAIFIRASDGRLMIKLWHSQLSAFGGTNSIRQVGTAQTSTAYTTYEWPFPAIDDVATSTNVSGSGTVQVTGNAIPIPSANGSGMATCRWQFTKGMSAPQVVNAPTEMARTPNMAVPSRGQIAQQATAAMPANPASASAGSAAGAGSPGSSGAGTAGAGSPGSSGAGAAPAGGSGTMGAAASGAAGAGNSNVAAGGAAAPGTSSGGSPAAGAAVSGAAAGGAGGAPGGAGGPENNTANEQPAATNSQASLQSTRPGMSSAALASRLSTLPAPAAFTAQSMGDGSVRLNWHAVSGASQYRLDGPGIPAAGLYVSGAGSPSTKVVHVSTITEKSVASPPLGTRIQNVPAGPDTWHIGTVDSKGAWNPNLLASATAVVRYVPSHSAPWLTKNNGSGSQGLAISHYLSLCPQCLPGADFGTIVQALGVPTDLTAAGNIFTAEPQWADNQAARYTNATEFGTNRVTKCWTATPGVRTVCYSNSGNHGLTVIVQQGDATWFLTFASSGPMGEVLNWGGGGGLGISSNYKLTTQVTLDSEGPKYAPHACLACHGGKLNGAMVTGATLLPLDTGLLRIDDRSDSMAANFLDVNRTVAAYFPSPAVKRYLNGLYSGDPSSASGWGNLDYVPAGWNQQSDFYKAAVRPYCMMCHLSTPSNLDFSTYGNFAQNKALISAEVCSGHTMPHAEYPFKNFWTKDTGNIFLPGYLAAGAGITSCQ